ARAALVVQCGKGNGKQQDEVALPGFACKLLQGGPFDGWPAGAARRHCWQDPKAVRFEVTVPKGTAGTLRLQFVDGDAKGRRQQVTVQGKARGRVEGFTGPGKTLDRVLTPAEVAAG